jgi:DNA-binding transcriptional ArsR family regulator
VKETSLVAVKQQLTKRVVRDAAQVAVVLAPIRAQLLQSLAEQKTVKQVAAELHLEANKLYYHLRRLEEGGFVEVVDTIPGRVPERVYRAIDFELDTSEWKVDEAGAASHAILRNVQREIQNAFSRGLGEGGRGMSILLAQVPARLNARQFERYQRKVAAILEELANEKPGRDARTYQVLAAIYPVDLDA